MIWDLGGTHVFLGKFLKLMVALRLSWTYYWEWFNFYNVVESKTDCVRSMWESAKKELVKLISYKNLNLRL